MAHALMEIFCGPLESGWHEQNSKGQSVISEQPTRGAVRDVITSATEGEGGYVSTPFCLFVCVQDISKSCGRIHMKFC